MIGRITMKRQVLLTMMLLTVLLTCSLIAEDVYAASYPFRSTTIYADGTRTAKFTCNGMTGLCCEAGAYSTYSGTASLSRMKNSTDEARCAYYYGYQKGWISGSNGHKLARLLSYCRGHGTGGDYSAATMKSLLTTARKATVPAAFECWLCKPGGSSRQDFIVWRLPKGNLKVLKKSAKTSVSGKGNYSLAGIVIKVYSDSACKTCVKTLTVTKSGSTGGAFSLPVGTYYVKEVKVPESTGYKLNSKATKVKVTYGSTVTVTMSNAPDTGSVTVKKKITAGDGEDGGSPQGFRFILTGKTSGKEYLLVTGPDGSAKAEGLPFGKYTLTEDLTDAQEKCYTDETGRQTFTLSKGSKTQHLTFRRENSYEPQQKIRIIKKTGDSGPVSGFRFNVTRVESEHGSIRAEDIVRIADPQVNLEDGKTLGIWQIADANEVGAVNIAASKGRTGTYQVTLRNTVTTQRSESDGGNGDDPGGNGSDGNGSEGDDSDKDSSGGDGSDEDDQDADGDGADADDADADDADGDDADADDADGDDSDADDADEDDPDEDDADADDSDADDTDGDDSDADVRGNTDTSGTGASGSSRQSVDTVEEPGVVRHSEEIRVKVEIELTGIGSSGTASGTGSAAGTTDSGTGSAAGTSASGTGSAASGTASGTGSATGANPIRKGAEKQTESEGYTVRSHTILFAGAAETSTESLVTGNTGQCVLEHVRPGTYIVEEVMTEQQKLRYRQPEEKTAIVREGSDETIVFSFVNEPIRIPVKLQKTSPDGRIEGVEFTLSGTPDYPGEAMEDIVLRTDEDGVIDFGLLYPGSYQLTETGFEAEEYVNTYPMKGREQPAFAFKITGEELSREQITRGGCLWLGGEAEHGGASKQKVEFRNIPYVDLNLTKVDGVTRSFLPGAEFTVKDSSGELAAQFRIDADEDGAPKPVMLKSNGVMTAGGGAPNRVDPVVIGVDDGEGAASDHDEGSTNGDDANSNVGGSTNKDNANSNVSGSTNRNSSDTDYQCIVLHGLIEGEKYTLTETSAPEGFTPLKESYIFTVTVDEKGHPVLNTCDEYGANIAPAAGGDTLVVVNDAPSIGTIALDNETGDHIAKADGNVTLTDHCRVSNLVKGRTYTLVARLMDNTAFLAGGDDGTVKQVTADGAPVTGQVTFRASGTEESIDVPITLTASALKGRSTVIYESLYPGEVQAENTQKLTAAAEESDPGNKSQSVVFPGIGTRAALTSRNVIEDEVAYTNLLPGRTYVMKGVLVDRTTGERIKGTVSEKLFRASSSGSGTMTVKFRIDAGALRGRGISEVVAFEQCWIVGTAEDTSGDSTASSCVAVHEDLKDRGQTVSLTGNPPKTGDDDTARRRALIALVLATIIGGGIVLRRLRQPLLQRL